MPFMSATKNNTINSPFRAITAWLAPLLLPLLFIACMIFVAPCAQAASGAAGFTDLVRLANPYIGIGQRTGAQADGTPTMDEYVWLQQQDAAAASREAAAAAEPVPALGSDYVEGPIDSLAQLPVIGNVIDLAAQINSSPLDRSSKAMAVDVASLATLGVGGWLGAADGAAAGIGGLAEGTAGEGAALRSSVLANIAESQAARVSSNIDALFAKEAQLNAGYNADAWSMATLPKGSIVYGGIPGQTAFYTDAATVVGSGGSRSALFQSLQVAPNPTLGFRPTLRVYELLQDMRVPTGTALGNPTLGPGGGQQFFIWNYGNQLRAVGDIGLGK